MAKLQIKKRGKVYQYVFEIAPVNGARKWISKSGFKTKAEAQAEGAKAYAEYTQTGQKFNPTEISYSDYLDYWLENYCEINLKYRTIETYKTIIRVHIKPKIGIYRLNKITKSTLQKFINDLYVHKNFSKSYLKNILKVIKTSFAYATDMDFIKINPALNIKIPKYDVPDEDPAHIFTKNEIEIILNRFRNSHCIYLAFLTAYYTGLIVSEVFALKWKDINFEERF